MMLAAYRSMAASLNCSIPPLKMLMLWYMCGPALTMQVPFFTTRSTAALPGPSGSPFVSGHDSSVLSPSQFAFWDELALRDESEVSADARRSGIGGRFEESEAPVAETAQTKPSERTNTIETN